MLKINKILKVKVGSITVLGIFLLLIVFGKNVGSQPQDNQQPQQTIIPIIEILSNANEAITSSTIQIKTDDALVRTAIPNSTQAPTDLIKIVSVVDGDTIKVSLDGKTQTIRLIGIDTPETVDPRKQVQCFGKEASNKAKATLTGHMVKLESDPTQGDIDKYQRLLRYVFLEDGTSFNKMMIADGYAHEYTYDTPYRYQADFKAAEKSARESQSGLWNPNTCNGKTDSIVATPQTSPAQIQTSTGHIYYLSTYSTAKFYYCDTDNGWKGLSPNYLKSYSSEEELLKNYPTKILHEPCK